jgi:poly(ADP-ribose) glycohydrolase ARH3
MPSLTRERFRGALLGLSLGDAAGAPFEGLPADYVYYVFGPIDQLVRASSAEPLRYTDDTQMMIGVAEALLRAETICPTTLGARWLANYQPERGYGLGARTMIEAVQAGGSWDELAESIFPGGSFGNGAAMRVAPVGLRFAPDLAQVAAEARTSAWLTHRRPLGIDGAVVFAVALALAGQGPPLDRKQFYRTLRKFCATEEFAWQLRAAQRLRRGHSIAFLGNSLPAHRSVGTALAGFTICPDSFIDAIVTMIALGDDTDTLAALTGALVGAYLGEAALPAEWLERLEDADRIRALADELWARHVNAPAVAVPT